MTPNPIIPPLQLAQAIVGGVGERNMDGEEGLDESNRQKVVDASLEAYYASLSDFPIARWLAFCEGIGPEPCLIAAATYCSGFNLEHLKPLLSNVGWHSAPWNEAHIASRFCAPSIWPEEHVLSLGKLKDFSGGSLATATFYIGAYDKYPHYDIETPLRELNAAIVSLLFFFGARDGFDKEQERRLFDYLKREDNPLGPHFWASFAAILRFPYRHDKVSLLPPLADGDPVRILAASALAGAIAAGPLTPEEAIWLHEIHAEGPLEARLARSLRLAAFVPGVCPMIDVFAPWPKQEKQAEKVRTAIDRVIASGISFTPAAYADKAHHIQAVKTEADERRKKLKERMAPRGWNESAIAEALANGPGIPVLGYPYGSALLRFHPETRLPIVSCAETGEVIHIGRADYVYDIDKDAYQAVPEEQRPSLPVWREPSPSAADLTPLYVRLKNEWIDVWRPVDGRWVERNVYCLMPHDIPEDETQEFWIGHYVECTVRRFGAGVGQAATKLAERR